VLISLKADEKNELDLKNLIHACGLKRYPTLYLMAHTITDTSSINVNYEDFKVKDKLYKIPVSVSFTDKTEILNKIQFYFALYICTKNELVQPKHEQKWTWEKIKDNWKKMKKHGRDNCCIKEDTIYFPDKELMADILIKAKSDAKPITTRKRSSRQSNQANKKKKTS